MTTKQLEIAEYIVKFLAQYDTHFPTTSIISKIENEYHCSNNDIRITLTRLALEQTFITYIDPSTKANVQITEQGKEAFRIGGIQAWKLKQKQEKEAQEIIQAESIKVAKSSANAAWVASIFAVAAFLLSAYQFYRSDQKDDEIFEINRKLNSLDSLVKTQIKQKKEIEVQSSSTKK